MNADLALRTKASQLVELGDTFRMPVLVAVAYYLATQAAFLVGTLSDKIFAPFWPPNIVLLCAFLLVPRQRWWLCILGALPAHVVAELGVGMPAPQWLVAFVTNVAVALIGAVAVQRLLGPPPWFSDLRKVFLYVLITAVASPAVVALGGAFVPILGGGAFENYWSFWAQWYLSNAVGSLALGPVALIWLLERDRSPAPLSTVQLVEAAVLTAALIATCAVVFQLSVGAVAAGFLPAVIYLPLPLLLWAAVRFGARGASAAILVVTVVLIWRALKGPSMFAAADPETSVFAIQAFLIGLAVPMLLLSASIDETREAERATRESEERMGFAAVAANMCLWHIDARSDRFWITDHGRRMLGFNSIEPITVARVISAVHPDDRQAVRDSIQSAAANGGLVDFEFRIVRPDGELRWLRMRARAQRNERGDDQVSGIFADFTERKAVETEAAQQRHELAHLMRVSMLGELSGGIAHELTQPLTAILSNAQAARLLMDGKSPDLTEVAEALDDIISEDNRAGEVIHRIRGLLKKEAARFELIDLNELVHSTLRLLHSELISRQVSIQADLAKQLPPVSGDPVQLQQVLLNLVVNAADAMTGMPPARRKIVVRTQVSGTDVEISVLDQGVGLTSVQQDQLFQPFFTTKQGGLGLGLTISSSIIKTHGGALTLQNNPGGGATASFKLFGLMQDA